MIKALSGIICVLMFVPVDMAHAQNLPNVSSKAYCGYYYSKKGVDHDRSCIIEFRSTVPFRQGPVVEVPAQISYFIKFKNPVFDKFEVKIYTSEGDENIIDPWSEGSQVGINEEHHITDSYLIYLLLGPTLRYIEIVGPKGDSQGKYLLDKIEIG